MHPRDCKMAGWHEGFIAWWYGGIFSQWQDAWHVAWWKWSHDVMIAYAERGRDAGPWPAWPAFFMHLEWLRVCNALYPALFMRRFMSAWRRRLTGLTGDLPANSDSRLMEFNYSKIFLRKDTNDQVRLPAYVKVWDGFAFFHVGLA